MRPNYNVKSTYLGAGNQSVYSFNFKIIEKSQLYVVHTDENDVVVFAEKGDNVTYIPSVTFNEAGGTITLTADLPLNHNLAIYFADDQPIQPQRFSNSTQLLLKQLENALDRVVGPVQKLFYWFKRVPRISDKWTHDFDGEIPEPLAEHVPIIKADRSGFELIDRSAFVGDQGIPGPMGPSGEIVAMNVVGELEYDDVTPMSVVNAGTVEQAILNFVLRKGPQGESTNLITVTNTLPNNMIGSDGDVWIFLLNGDPQTGNFYQKEAGSYVLKGNIRGPAGGVNTVEGAIGDVTFEDMGIENGVTMIPMGQSFVDVVFATPRADDQYVVIPTIENLVNDPNDMIWLIGTITVKQNTGFRMNFIAPVDNNNYKLAWEVKRKTV